MTEGSRYRLPHHYAVGRGNTEFDTPEIPTWNDDTEMHELVEQSSHVGTPNMEYHNFNSVTSYNPVMGHDITR